MVRKFDFPHSEHEDFLLISIWDFCLRAANFLKCQLQFSGNEIKGRWDIPKHPNVLPYVETEDTRSLISPNSSSSSK